MKSRLFPEDLPPCLCLPQPAVPAFFVAWNLPLTPPPDLLQGRGLVRFCGANGEEGNRWQGSLASSDTTPSWVGRASLRSRVGPLMQPRWWPAHDLGHSSLIPGLPQHCPRPNPEQMLDQRAERKGYCSCRDQEIKRESRFTSCLSQFTARLVLWTEVKERRAPICHQSPFPPLAGAICRAGCGRSRSRSVAGRTLGRTGDCLLLQGRRREQAQSRAGTL